MAGSYNKVLLMGNLTRDVELRYLPNSNTAVAAIGLAVNRKFRMQSGEEREEVAFIDCEAFGKTAEIMSQYLRKGRPVFVEGRLKLDQWDDKASGQKRSKLKVVVEEFRFVDSPGGAGGEGGGGGRPQPAGARRSGGGQTDHEEHHAPVTEDDIPF
jgi:single-strand DNA-binding protein